MNCESTLVTPNITHIRRFVIPDCPAHCFVVRGPQKTLVINTHSHWDHVWGNAAFSDELLVPGDGVELFWTPGPTTDGINLRFPRERTLFAGDNGGDNEENPWPELENSVVDYAGAVERYRRVQPRLVLSGHHTPAGPAFLDRIVRALERS